MKRTKKLILLPFLMVSLTFLGCSNVFKSASQKDTDAALYEDALKMMDSQDWDGAIAKFTSMSANYKTDSEVIESWAGALAGKCGLDFIGYFTNLGSASLTGSTIFKYLMNAWTDKIIYPNYCTLAQSKLEEISTNPANRTSGQNIFMAVLGMVKIGVYLRNNMDVDGANGLGDGTTDAPPGGFTYSSCASTRLSDANLNEVITGLGLVTANLVYLTAVLSSGSMTGALNAVNTACASLSGACGKTDPAQVTNVDRQLLRELLSTGPSNPTYAMGIETCNKDFLNPPGNFCCP